MTEHATSFVHNVRIRSLRGQILQQEHKVVISVANEGTAAGLVAHGPQRAGTAFRLYTTQSLHVM